ncbi:MAG: hypothetical protein HC887_00070 [Desulfobacteraceae bacterium]|nr:hypothetical protein [Desulfobacteraceae bacterium]
MRDLIELMFVAAIAFFGLFLCLTALKIPLTATVIGVGAIAGVQIVCKTYLIGLKMKQTHEIERMKLTGSERLMIER